MKLCSEKMFIYDDNIDDLNNRLRLCHYLQIFRNKSDIFSIDICYYSEGVQSIEYKKNGGWHRDNGLPAVEYYDVYGNIYLQQWFIDGIPHNDYSYAVINHPFDANDIFVEWIFNGIEKTKDVNIWLKENNIILSKENNYEIPDEHKAEFKLIFH